MDRRAVCGLLTVIVLTLVLGAAGSAPASAAGRVAWIAAEPGAAGPLMVAADDGGGGGGARRLAPSAAAFALSPDGGAAVYDDARGATWLVAGAPRRRMPSGVSAARAAWAPDGRTVAFARVPAARVLVVDRAGRTRMRRALGAGGRLTGVAFSPGGTRLAVTRAGRVVTLRADGHGVLARVALPEPDVYGPLWTPRGVAVEAGVADDATSPSGYTRFSTYLGGAPLSDLWGLPRSLSPDGARFALAGTACVWELARGACAPGTGAPGLTVQDLSPDGDAALVTAGGRLATVALGGDADAAPVPVAGGPVADAQWAR